MHEEYQSIMKNKGMGCSSETRREVSSNFQMDLQDQTCSRWKYRQVQSKVHGSWVLLEGRNIL